MTAFDNIKTNNWPAASNEFDDFLVLELPLNDQAALTSSRRDIVAGSKVLFPKRTLTNTGGVSMQYARNQPDYGATGFTKSNNWRETNYEAPEDGLFNGDGTSTIAAINGDNAEHWFAFPTALTNVTKVETRMGYDGNQGARAYMGTGTTNYISPGGSGTFFTVYSGVATTFSKIGWRSNNGSGAAVYDIRITDDTGTYILTSNENLKKHYDNNSVFTAATQPGSGNRLSLDNLDGLSMGANESWCFEAYINPTQVSDATFFGLGNTGFAYRIIGGSPYLYVGGTGNILSTGTIPVDTWTHVAVSRDVNTLRSFINGTQVGSNTTNTASWDVTSGTGAGVFIGAANLTNVSPPNYHFDGKIQDLRFYKGTAKYTSNFTPPSAILG